MTGNKKDRYHRCIRMLPMLFAALLSVGGCGKNTAEERTEYGCFQIGTNISDQGMITQSGSDGKHIPLTVFFDPESGICTPICAKLNCSHDSRDCDADFGDCVLLEGDYLYYVIPDPEGEQVGDFVFMRADADGTNRKVLQRIRNATACLWPNCEEGYLIYPYFNNYDEEGNRKKQSETGIWLLHLASEKFDHIEMPGAYDAKVVLTMMSHGILYFTYNYSTVDWSSYSYEELTQMDEETRMEAYRAEIWKYDPATKECVCLLSAEETAGIGFGGGRLVKKDASSGKLTLSEPEGKKKWEVTLPFPAEECGIYYLEHEILFYSGKTNEIQLYDLNSKKWKQLGTVDCDGGSFSMRAVTEHWVYIQRWSEQGEPDGMYYIPREDFYNGKTDWKKAAGYENRALLGAE